MIKRLFRWLSPGEAHAAPPSVGGIFGRMTPEGICGIDPATMTPEEIRRRLAELYKRHNAAAGSLDPELRREAETMLDAIVACREKHVETAV